MSQQETKRGAAGEFFNALTSPEKRIEQTLVQAKELVEKHPKAALVAAVAVGVLGYEMYKRNYEERTGEKLAGPHAVLGDIQKRFEENPEGIKGEVHNALDGISNYIKHHRGLSIAVAFAGPFILRHVANMLEPQTTQPAPAKPRTRR